MKELLMGNEAIALGALAAGVGVVTGYPGTPSTEVLETVAKRRGADVYVEWSVNEKSALEVAAGAAYTGKRTMVTMKQVGLNVASDPLMSLAYIGVVGGMVVLVADDPGPISSQTEQDTRTFAGYAKLPVFDPSSPEEAFEMIGEAFEFSERYGTPVLFRPTTRICHATAVIDVPETHRPVQPGVFEKSPRWGIFPRLAFENHKKIEARNRALEDTLSSYERNRVTVLAGGENAKRALVTSGVGDSYAAEALKMLGEPATKILRVATPFPFPNRLAEDFLRGVEEVLCVEELDPVLERALLQLSGEKHLAVTVRGKRTGDLPAAGEYTAECVRAAVARFLGVPDLPAPEENHTLEAPPKLPVRPPVLCAGCPHRASFYAVKEAAKGQKVLFAGDIGCYTLGNAMDASDTCLCMGAGITVAQGITRGEPDRHAFAFVGDSTFFHTGIPGVANAVYNGAHLTVVVLDNDTTAMTGHQPHPGTGVSAVGGAATKLSIPKILDALGVSPVLTVDPFDLPAAVSAAKQAMEAPGVSAILFKSPCAARIRPGKPVAVTESCVNCGKCVRELGCPALRRGESAVSVDATLCTGCGLCADVCPFGALKKEGR